MNILKEAHKDRRGDAKKMHKDYVIDTKGDTVVLFIHGILGSPDHFKKFMDLVPESCAIYNILLDGHGKKPENLRNTSMKKWKEQVEKTVEYLSQRYEKIIIAAHSMGTLFAVNQGVKFGKKVKALFLMSIPLAVDVKITAIKNSLKVVFDKEENLDEVAKAMKKGCSIELDRRMWNYIGWVPRYAELLAEVSKTKEILPMIDIPTLVFQSKNDELVSLKSEEYLKSNPDITYFILESSCHFYYSDHDMAIMQREFEALVKAGCPRSHSE